MSADLFHADHGIHQIDEFSHRLRESLSRLSRESRRIEANVSVVEGLYFSFDTEGGQTDLTCCSNNGFAVSGRISGAPRWCSLNMDLGQTLLEAGQVIGIAARLTSPAGLQMPLSIRSALPGGELADTFLDGTLRGDAGGTAQVVLHHITPDMPACGLVAWHTLVLGLPPGPLEFTFTDLRVFSARSYSAG